MSLLSKTVYRTHILVLIASFETDQGAVGTLDVSAWKVMNNYVRKRQITNEYTLHKGKNGVPKKLVINKKLRKADKKWIKKFAKKWHVKVVEK